MYAEYVIDITELEYENQHDPFKFVAIQKGNSFAYEV